MVWLRYTLSKNINHHTPLLAIHAFPAVPTSRCGPSSEHLTFPHAEAVRHQGFGRGVLPQPSASLFSSSLWCMCVCSCHLPA